MELLFTERDGLRDTLHYWLREGVKYYFADFVRKGGGGAGVPPKSVTPFSLKKKSVKGGVPPLRTKSAK